MSALFGWCLDADGAAHAYCSQCPREYVDQYGIRHVCGCVNHEIEEHS